MPNLYSITSIINSLNTNIAKTNIIEITNIIYLTTIPSKDTQNVSKLLVSLLLLLKSVFVT